MPSAAVITFWRDMFSVLRDMRDVAPQLTALCNTVETYLYVKLLPNTFVYGRGTLPVCGGHKEHNFHMRKSRYPLYAVLRRAPQADDLPSLAY